MKTTCEECSREVRDDEVGKCGFCDADGLCPICVAAHATGEHTKD